MRRSDGVMGRGWMSAGAIAMLVAGLMLSLSGCAEPSSSTSLTNTRADAAGNPASLVRGPRQSASYQGSQPSQITLNESVSFTTPGEGAVVSFGNLQMWSPKDIEASGIKLVPQPEAPPKLTIKSLNANISDVAEVRAGQFAEAMTAIQGMTEDEARRRIQQMKEAGDITGDVADAITSVLPKLVGSP